MKSCTSAKKLNPYGLAFWNKPFVMPEEIELFTGGVVDYPTVAEWEAEDRPMIPSVEIPGGAYPKKVVVGGCVYTAYIDNDRRFFGEIHEPVLAYEVGSLWDWLVRRVGLEPDEDFAAQEAGCSNPETDLPF